MIEAIKLCPRCKQTWKCDRDKEHYCLTCAKEIDLSTNGEKTFSVNEAIHLGILLKIDVGLTHDLRLTEYFDWLERRETTVRHTRFREIYHPKQLEQTCKS